MSKIIDFFKNIFNENDEENDTLVMSDNHVNNVKFPSERNYNNIEQINSISPISFEDVKLIGDPYREGIPVIVNLSKCKLDDKPRIIDFSLGLKYSVNGKITFIDPNSQDTFLLAHNGTEIQTNYDQQDTGEIINS